MSSAGVPSCGDSGVEEWLELESDPGVFSLLIEDYGVRGVKVEEVYDISQKFDSTVLGFVFLFRYELTDRRARKKARDMTELASYVLDDNVVNGMFFAHQIITNSCATHALLSVLLNCQDLDIGPNLTRLRDFTQGLDPESKGFAIANMMELAHIHNKHARPQRTVAPPISGRKSSVVSSAFALLPETYHYVSFVPINGRLFELDGLKEFPIDHGPWGEEEKWTDLFQRTVTQRLRESQDCLFNLMALIPDPVPQISERLKKLQDEQTALLEATAKLAQQVRAKKEQKKSVSAGGSAHSEASMCESQKSPVKKDIKQENTGEDTSSNVASTSQAVIAGSAEPHSEKVIAEPRSEEAIADSAEPCSEEANTGSAEPRSKEANAGSAEPHSEEVNAVLAEPRSKEANTGSAESRSEEANVGLVEPRSEEVKPMEVVHVGSDSMVKNTSVASAGPAVETDSVMDTETEKSSKEEPSEKNSIVVNTEKELIDNSSMKEEPMEVSNSVETCDSIATLLSVVSRTLPTEPSELVSIANTRVDGTVSLDESLRVTVAKVLRNHKEMEEFKQKLKEEVEIKQRFRIEHSRRIHDYDAFIFDFVKCLAQNRQLPERLLRRPTVAPPLKGGGGGRHKRKNIKVPRKSKTTLLLNGNEVK